MEDKLVTIATDHYTAAEVLKARLESSGIECFLKNVNLLQGAVSEGVKVQIRESDVEKALRIIMELKNQQEEKETREHKELRRILVPVDFSHYSKAACFYALRLAQKYNADLKILHVFYAPIVDLVPITDAYSIQVDMDINLRELEEQAKIKLTNFIADIRKKAIDDGFPELKISYSLREGIVEDEIALMAKTFKPGIIVMGTKGKGVKQSDIIGTVVYRVLDQVKVPILAIPEKADADKIMEISNIAYITDFDDTDYLAVRRLFTIVAAFQVNIHCLHITRTNEDKWVDVKLEGLKNYFSRINSNAQVECSVLKGENLVNSLETFCGKNNIDIIALTNKKRGLLQRMFNPDLTKKLIHSANLPLLIFRN